MLRDQPIIGASFGQDAFEDAFIKLLIALGRDIWAIQSGEWEVQQPTVQVVTVPKHEVLRDGKVVRMKRASKPRAS